MSFTPRDRDFPSFNTTKSSSQLKAIDQQTVFAKLPLEVTVLTSVHNVLAVGEVRKHYE